MWPKVVDIREVTFHYDKVVVKVALATETGNIHYVTMTRKLDWEANEFGITDMRCAISDYLNHLNLFDGLVQFENGVTDGKWGVEYG